MNRFLQLGLSFLLILVCASFAAAQQRRGGGDREDEDRPRNRPPVPEGFRVRYEGGTHYLSWRAIRAPRRSADDDESEEEAARRVVGYEVYRFAGTRAEYVLSVSTGASSTTIGGYPRDTYFQLRAVSAGGTYQSTRFERAR